MSHQLLREGEGPRTNGNLYRGGETTCTDGETTCTLCDFTCTITCDVAFMRVYLHNNLRFSLHFFSHPEKKKKN